MTTPTAFFEIHVTVAPPSDYENFRTDCMLLGVKPLRLSLLSRSGAVVMEDYMTSSKHKLAFEGATEACADIADKLASWGYTVLRKKIETVPWNPMEKEYLESHLEVTCYDTESFREFLVPIAIDNNGYISHNTNKPGVYMLTLRAFDTPFWVFEDKVEDIRDGLLRQGFEVGDVEIEAAVYDTRYDHDKAWLDAA